MVYLIKIILNLHHKTLYVILYKFCELSCNYSESEKKEIVDLNVD